MGKRRPPWPDVLHFVKYEESFWWTTITSDLPLAEQIEVQFRLTLERALEIVDTAAPDGDSESTPSEAGTALCASSRVSVWSSMNSFEPALIRPGILKTGVWRRVKARTGNSLSLDQRWHGQVWHENHGPPRHDPFLFDNCAALLRCLWVSLPLHRIELAGRDSKALCVEEFAQKYAAPLSDVVKESNGLVSNALYTWLGRMTTHGGDGKRIKLGKAVCDCVRLGKAVCDGIKLQRNRFGWTGFYLEDDTELHGLVTRALHQWRDSNPPEARPGAFTF